MDVGKAVVEGDEAKINDTFYVRTLTGGKLSDDKAADAVRSLEVLLRSKPSSTDVSRPKFEAQGQGQSGKARLYTLMGKLSRVCLIDSPKRTPLHSLTRRKARTCLCHVIKLLYAFPLPVGPLASLRLGVGKSITMYFACLNHVNSRTRYILFSRKSVGVF